MLINRILFCSAFFGETDLLKKSRLFPHLLEAGIGNLNAGINTFEYLLKHPEIETIVFIGSCGAYPWAKIHTGSIVVSSEFDHLEIAAQLGITKQILNDKSLIGFAKDNPTLLGLSDFAKKQNQFTDRIFFSKKTNAPTCLSLKNLDSPPGKEWDGLDVENLELYGLAIVAKKLNKNLFAILSVTNQVGSEGSADWQKNWRDFSNSLQNLLLKWTDERR
ncbi:phosphorylase [Leptospira ilyithenensis]|uniref:phosphorylase n=1 Tax=Leptospira ilyithenensis TaxID=2484901 RepID=UPI001AEF58BB|nr:phosphorylase [Leptospira ilyithenensis]